MMVRVLDVNTLSWAVLTPSGDAPPSRGSHSVSNICMNFPIICTPCTQHQILQECACRESCMLTVGDSKTPVQYWAYACIHCFYGLSRCKISLWLSPQATLVGAKVWVFGGEDAARRPLDDVHVLNLADMSWTTPQLTGKGPSRRSAHSAAAYADRWLLVFGGGSLVRDAHEESL